MTPQERQVLREAVDAAKRRRIFVSGGWESEDQRAEAERGIERRVRARLEPRVAALEFQVQMLTRERDALLVELAAARGPYEPFKYETEEGRRLARQLSWRESKRRAAARKRLQESA